MKKHFGYTIFLGIILLSLFSCVTAYVPNVVPTPALKEKGDLMGTVTLGNTGLNPQFAYAVTDNIGIMANGGIFASVQENLWLYGEMGGGYYKEINEILRFDVYGGAGMGMAESYYQILWSSLAVNCVYAKGFIQPSFGVNLNKAEFNISQRLVYVNMLADYTTSISGDPNGNPNQYSNTRDAYFFEPAFTAKFGNHNVKGFFQVGLSISLSKKNYEHRNLILSGGIQLPLRKKN